MTSKAFVDTTVLTDALLGLPEKRKRAKAALERFETTELPEYAIKEFKLGPLTNFNWMHTKLVQTQSLTDTLAALQVLSVTPQRYKTATAIQALSNAMDSIGHLTHSELQQKYGSKAALNEMLFDETRLAVKAMILRAWQQRRNVTDQVVCPLSCYDEKDPRAHRDCLDLTPRDCPTGANCCVAEEMKKGKSELQRMREATIATGERSELKKRARCLRKLYRTPKRRVDRQDCRALGDAVFAYFAPAGSTILTTNLRDFVPLAETVGKRAEAP